MSRANPFSDMNEPLSEHRGRTPQKTNPGWGFSAGAAMFNVFTLATLVVILFMSAQTAYTFSKIPVFLAVLGILWSLIACIKEASGFSFACLILSLLLGAGSFYLMTTAASIGIR